MPKYYKVGTELHKYDEKDFVPVSNPRGSFNTFDAWMADKAPKLQQSGYQEINADEYNARSRALSELGLKAMGKPDQSVLSQYDALTKQYLSGATATTGLNANYDAQVAANRAAQTPAQTLTGAPAPSTAYGQVLNVGGQNISPLDPNYEQYAKQMGIYKPYSYDSSTAAKITSDSLKQTNPLNPVISKDTQVFNIAGLNSNPAGTPPSNANLGAEGNKAQGLTEQIQAMQNELLGESAYRTSQEQTQDIAGLTRSQNDLSSRLRILQNEAAAIPLQLQQEATGRGITTELLGRQQNDRLRTNAIAALGVASLLEASRGNLSTAMELVDRAVAQKYDPIRERISTAKANLQLILQSPAYTEEEKQRALAQQEIQNAKAEAANQAEADEKTIRGLANEVASTGGVREAEAIQKAESVEEANKLYAEYNAAQIKTSQDDKLAAAGYEYVNTPAKRDQLKKQGYEILVQGGRTYAKAPEPVAVKASSGGGGGNGNSGGGGETGANGSLTDFDIMAEAVSNKLGSVAAKKSFEEQFAKAKTDDQKIKILAANVVLPTEIKNGIIQNTQVIKSLDGVLAMLDNGVKTGLLEAGQSYLANKFGTGGDKEIEAIKSKLVTAIQPYRNKVTGAAWGTQEEQEYQTLLGSVKFAPEDLRNKLEVFKDTLKQQSQTAILAGIDPLGAINADSSIQDSQYFNSEPKIENTNSSTPETTKPATSQGFLSKTWNWLFGD